MRICASLLGARGTRWHVGTAQQPRAGRQRHPVWHAQIRAARRNSSAAPRWSPASPGWGRGTRWHVGTAQRPRGGPQHHLVWHARTQVARRNSSAATRWSPVPPGYARPRVPS